MVYVPFAGFGTDPLPLLTPPHADRASPSDASAITQAICRSFRHDLPRNPAISNPANAIPAGTGMPFFGAWLLARSEPFACGINRWPLALIAPADKPAQSDAFVSTVICPVTAADPGTVMEPFAFV